MFLSMSRAVLVRRLFISVAFKIDEPRRIAQEYTTFNGPGLT